MYDVRASEIFAERISANVVRETFLVLQEQKFLPWKAIHNECLSLPLAIAKASLTSSKRGDGHLLENELDIFVNPK